jgi:hypothetical protein
MFSVNPDIQAKINNATGLVRPMQMLNARDGCITAVLAMSSLSLCWLLHSATECIQFRQEAPVQRTFADACQVQGFWEPAHSVVLPIT